jgi:hypothetical protein
METLEIPDASGHTTVRWDPDKPEEVAEAQGIIDNLKAKGYSFFEAEGEPGALTIRRVQSPAMRRSTRPRRHIALRPLAGG